MAIAAKRSVCHVKDLCSIQRCVTVPPVAVYWFFGSRPIDEFTADSGVVDGRRLIRRDRFFDWQIMEDCSHNN